MFNNKLKKKFIFLLLLSIFFVFKFYSPLNLTNVVGFKTKFVVFYIDGHGWGDRLEGNNELFLALFTLLFLH